MFCCFMRDQDGSSSLEGRDLIEVGVDQDGAAIEGVAGDDVAGVEGIPGPKREIHREEIHHGLEDGSNQDIATNHELPPGGQERHVRVLKEHGSDCRETGGCPFQLESVKIRKQFVVSVKAPADILLVGAGGVGVGEVGALAVGRTKGREERSHLEPAKAEQFLILIVSEWFCSTNWCGHHGDTSQANNQNLSE